MVIPRVAKEIRALQRAVFSAYRRVPVRWRLGGGSAALTFVILAGFAVVTDVLTDRQIANSFYARDTTAIASLANRISPVYDANIHAVVCQGAVYDPANQEAEIRLFADDSSRTLLCSDRLNTKTGQLLNEPRFSPTMAAAELSAAHTAYFENGYRVNVDQVSLPVASGKSRRPGSLLYALPLSSLYETTREVRIFLTAGVLGGAILSLLAGLIVAQRAMRPVSSLTEAAREIERTRDPSLRIPHPEAEDEVAELARTLESMLGALAGARNETEGALTRQREFVADASHELRTPLTSVLANLELLADELSGEQADSANAALRSTRRMRRLVADLLLLARADVGRLQARTATDLADCLTDAASELTPTLANHDLTIDAGSAVVDGINDDLHRLILNLLENAISHTPPGSHIHAASGIEDGRPTLTVEDDGPGIPAELQARVFERFVRGGGDAGHGPRGSGLGLAIVDAVAGVHDATVELKSLPQLHGTRFTITFPASSAAATTDAAAPSREGAETLGQTSTTTGRTIGRRRNRS